MGFSKKILVPVDFTKVSDIAIEHALLMGKTILADIHLIHIVENKKQVSEVRLKLDALKDRVRVENSVEIHAHVRIGNIFEDIDKAATEMDAALIIMGTHGARGLQFMTGSRALKIVTESSIPFIVVQERTIREHGYHRLVVPLDLHKETKQKLSAVRDVAKYFNSKVYLISPNETDEFLKNQLDRNLNYAVEYLRSKDIPVEVEITETKSEGSFVKSLLKYSAAVEADLICIMNFYESSLLNVFNSSYEQHVITNDAQIPALCVNPVDTYIADRSSLAS
jgi:nucleotide-binding universal stress UspA family protein